MFTYDPSTDFGKVRLLAFDSDSANALFQDNEIQAFLDLNSQNVRLAAAQAIEVVAGSQALVTKFMIVDGDQFDGTKVSMELRARATELRRQVMEGDADGAGLFDIAEQVLDTFTFRERLLNEMLRQTGP